MTLQFIMTWRRSTTWEEVREKPSSVLMACSRSATVQLASASPSAQMTDLGTGTIPWRAAWPEVTVRTLCGGTRPTWALEQGLDETERKHGRSNRERRILALVAPLSSCTVRTGADS